MIYNYDPIYVGKDGNSYEQMYIFPKKKSHVTMTTKTSKENGSKANSQTLLVTLITTITAVLHLIMS